jgi:hypothetical protein
MVVCFESFHCNGLVGFHYKLVRAMSTCWGTTFDLIYYDDSRKWKHISN